eukprot:COSAG05_NODE_1092_length_5914_cov_16.615305_2_plen_71_part_00
MWRHMAQSTMIHVSSTKIYLYINGRYGRARLLNVMGEVKRSRGAEFVAVVRDLTEVLGGKEPPVDYLGIG